MQLAATIDLVSVTYTTDTIGQKVKHETTTTLPATVTSISRAEWTAAGQLGLTPSYVVTVFSGDYAGETSCVLDGVRFAIYRTYSRDDGYTELYLERQAGVE